MTNRNKSLPHALGRFDASPAGRLVPKFNRFRFRRYARELSKAVQELSRERPMSITGLQSGAFQAMLAEMRKEIADAQAEGVAEVKAAKEAAANDIKNTIAGVKDKIRSEVSDALQEFSQFTNGAPSLDEPVGPTIIPQNQL